MTIPKLKLGKLIWSMSSLFTCGSVFIFNANAEANHTYHWKEEYLNSPIGTSTINDEIFSNHAESQQKNIFQRLTDTKLADSQEQSEQQSPEITIDQQWLLNDKNKSQALGFSIGTFTYGYYAPYNTCSAWLLCSEKRFGFAASVNYTKRIFHSGRTSLDIDGNIGIGHQSISKSWYKSIPESQQTRTFGLASIVPTVRARLPGPFRKISVGAGAGISAAVGGTIPYEYPYDIPLMVAINAEIAYQPFIDSKSEFTLSLRHRCAAFGALNSTDDAQVGSNWAMLGFRKWF